MFRLLTWLVRIPWGRALQEAPVLWLKRLKHSENPTSVWWLFSLWGKELPCLQTLLAEWRGSVLNSQYWVRFVVLRITWFTCPFIYSAVFFFHAENSYFRRILFLNEILKFLHFQALNYLIQICGLQQQNPNTLVYHWIFKLWLSFMDSWDIQFH